MVALEQVTGPLLDNPYRLGKPLTGRHRGQHVARCGAGYRIRYVIDDRARKVVVLDVSRRADAYREE